MIMKNFLITIFNYKNIDHDLHFHSFTFDLCLNCFLYIYVTYAKILPSYSPEYSHYQKKKKTFFGIIFVCLHFLLIFGDERMMSGWDGGEWRKYHSRESQNFWLTRNLCWSVGGFLGMRKGLMIFHIFSRELILFHRNSTSENKSKVCSL